MRAKAATQSKKLEARTADAAPMLIVSAARRWLPQGKARKFFARLGGQDSSTAGTHNTAHAEAAGRCAGI